MNVGKAEVELLRAPQEGSSDLNHLARFMIGGLWVSFRTTYGGTGGQVYQEDACLMGVPFGLSKGSISRAVISIVACSLSKNWTAQLLVLMSCASSGFASGHKTCSSCARYTFVHCIKV